MKQTAVEWLVEQLENHNGITRAGLEKCIQDAKKMEKDQIVNSFSEGTKMIDVNDELSAIFNGIIYYDETFKQ